MRLGVNTGEYVMSNTVCIVILEQKEAAACAPALHNPLYLLYMYMFRVLSARLLGRRRTQ